MLSACRLSCLMYDYTCNACTKRLSSVEPYFMHTSLCSLISENRKSSPHEMHFWGGPISSLLHQGWDICLEKNYIQNHFWLDSKTRFYYIDLIYLAMAKLFFLGSIRQPYNVICKINIIQYKPCLNIRKKQIDIS